MELVHQGNSENSLQNLSGRVVRKIVFLPLTACPIQELHSGHAVRVKSLRTHVLGVHALVSKITSLKVPARVKIIL